MRRLLQVTIISLFVVGLSAVMASGFTPDKRAQARERCTNPKLCDRATLPPSTGGPKPVVPPQKQAYCTDPAFPNFHAKPLPQYQTADDKTIGSLNTGFDPKAYNPKALVIPDIAVAQRVAQWCSDPAGVISKYDYFWVPLATEHSVALTAGLLAEVQTDLTYPHVVWLDVDKEHDWLWVNIEHHAGITPPPPVEARATDGNEVTGYATAWIKATPVSFAIELPDESGVTGGQLASCDLTVATSAKGCAIKFTHASSITKDGTFSGRATITWAVSSNSGKYNGVGPFTTSSEVRVRVAESMAVSQPGG